MAIKERPSLFEREMLRSIATVVRVMQVLHRRPEDPTEEPKPMKLARLPKATIAGQSWWQRTKAKLSWRPRITGFMTKETLDRLKAEEEQREIDEIAAMLNGAFSAISHVTGQQLGEAATAIRRAGQAPRPSATAVPGPGRRRQR